MTRSAKYISVLRSERWRALKLRRLMVCGFACEGCGQRYSGNGPKGALKAFDLHHTHYQTLGCERLEDVRILCRECHSGQHEYAAGVEETTPANQSESAGAMPARRSTEAA